jgi:hypothetical protein
MAGTVIAYKTTKDDQRIEEWWASIEGSKAQTLKAAILFYLDNYGRGGGNGGGVQSDDPPGWVAEMSQGFQDAVASLPDAVSAGVLQALVPVLMQIASTPLPPPSANYVPAYEQQRERSYQIKRPSLEDSFERSQQLIEDAEESTEAAQDALESAAAAFVNMFG